MNPFSTIVAAIPTERTERSFPARIAASFLCWYLASLIAFAICGQHIRYLFTSPFSPDFIYFNIYALISAIMNPALAVAFATSTVFLGIYCLFRLSHLALVIPLAILTLAYCSGYVSLFR